MEKSFIEIVENIDPQEPHLSEGLKAFWLCGVDEDPNAKKTVPCLIKRIQEELILIEFVNEQGEIKSREVISSEVIADLYGRNRFTNSEIELHKQIFISYQDVEFIETLKPANFDLIKGYNKKKLPQIPADCRLIDNSNLTVRTYNVLQEHDWLNYPEKLSGKSIQELLNLRKFGTKSLVNLLSVLKPWFPGGALYGFSSTTGENNPSSETAMLESLLPKELSAELFNLTAHNIDRIYDSLKKFTVSFRDPRFGSKLTDIDYSVESFNQILQDIKEKKPFYATQEQLAKIVEKVNSLCFDLEQSFQIFLEEELMEILFAIEENDRKRDIFIQRTGLTGAAPKTLEEVGIQYGLTRERIRQIEHKIRLKFEEANIFAPLLKRTADNVEDLIPAPVTILQRRLISKGITSRAYNFDALKSIFTLFGFPDFFYLNEARNVQIAMSPEDSTIQPGQLISKIRKLVGKKGIGRLEEVLSLSQILTQMEYDSILELVKSQPDFCWIDQSKGLFWFLNINRSKFINQIRKILTVTPQIDIRALRYGVRRHHRTQDFDLSSSQLLELCERLPWCGVSGDMVYAQDMINAEDIFEETELKMYSLLTKHGPILPRAEFELLCKREGILRGTFYAYLNYSPILQKYERGIYGLRGLSHNTDKIPLSMGTTSSGKSWLNFEITDRIIATGGLVLPAETSEQLQGRFNLKETGFTDSLFIEESYLKDLRNLLKKRGIEAGEFLLLLFDLDKRQVIPLLSEGQPDDQELDILADEVFRLALLNEREPVLESTIIQGNLDGSDKVRKDFLDVD